MSQADEAKALVTEISGILHGRDPNIVGAALADLLSMLLAGHFLFTDDGGISRKPTDKLREDLLLAHLEAVRKLLPVNEKMILARTKREAS